MQEKQIRPLQRQVCNFPTSIFLVSSWHSLAQNHAVSYLFRSLGSVIGLSVGSTLIQGTLLSALHRKLTGADVDEVCESLGFLSAIFEPLSHNLPRIDYQESSGIPDIPRRTGSIYTVSREKLIRRSYTRYLLVLRGFGRMRRGCFYVHQGEAAREQNLTQRRRKLTITLGCISQTQISKARTCTSCETKCVLQFNFESWLWFINDAYRTVWGSRWAPTTLLINRLSLVAATRA
jgi:hypothetical protein